MSEHIENNTPSSGINPNRAHFNAGSGQFASGASFARQFRSWFHSQQRFGRQADFAQYLGVGASTLQFWFAGRAFPSDPLCDKLFEITQLECFSPVGRESARVEHETKRGLSRPGLKKRASRRHLSEAEREECLADPDKAFTIKGDAWIACLECGRLLRQIHGKKPAGHLLEHGISDEEYRRGRYGKNVGLVCRELSKAQAARSFAVYEGRLKRFAGTRVPPSRKGQKNPPEFSRHQSARMRGTRSPNLAKDVPDVEFVWAWLIEEKDVRSVGQTLQFTIGGAWARLKSILGVPVRKTFHEAPDFASVERAIKVVQQCRDDYVALKAELAKLSEQSRREVVSGNPQTRTVLLLIPKIRTLNIEGRASDLALSFLQEKAWKNRRPRRTKRTPGHKKGWMTARTQKRLRLAAALWCFGLNPYKIAAIVYGADSKANDDAYDKYSKLIDNQNRFFTEQCERLDGQSAAEIIRTELPEK